MLIGKPPREGSTLSGYNLALFIHVLSIVALFASLAIVLVSMGGSARGTVCHLPARVRDQYSTAMPPSRNDCAGRNCSGAVFRSLFVPRSW